MQKIISLFQRNHETDRLVRDEIVPGAEWVIAGEGVASRKWDGTCCLTEAGLLYKRFDCKKGRTAPEGFRPAQEAPDPVTGHWPGWLLIGDGPEDRWHREALAKGSDVFRQVSCPPLTFELCGPKINGNPEGLKSHRLLFHGLPQFPDAPRSFEAIRDWLATKDIEGIVWHHPDGRMVKIKKKDFGLRRKPD